MSKAGAGELRCPQCGHVVRLYRNPLLTVDIIIEAPGIGDFDLLCPPRSCSGHVGGGGAPRGIVLIERRNPPLGWAIPGGFVDYGESLEAAAIREAREETGMELVNLRQFHAYSDPQRDPRGHTVSVVFTALGEGVPEAGDDAKNLRIFSFDRLPENLVFDHALILSDYLEAKSKR